MGEQSLPASQSFSDLHELTDAKALLFSMFWGVSVVVISKFPIGRVHTPLLIMLIHLLVMSRSPLGCELRSWHTVGIHNILMDE